MRYFKFNFIKYSWVLTINFFLFNSGLTQNAPLSSKSKSKLNAQSTNGAIFLLGRLTIPKPTADVWGYLDQNTGREFALVGYGIFTDPPNAGVVIADVTNPSNPIQVANINTIPGFDVKTWNHYIYSVNGLSNGFGAIVDISTPENPQVVGSFPSSHNIWIDDRGFMYLECPGLRIFDLNPDPTNPKLIWRDQDNLQGNNQFCHDAAVIGDRLFDFHGSAETNIYDITNATNPQLLGTIHDPTINFHHSGWTTQDGQFLFICDELAIHPIADFTVWDISDLTNPQKVGEFSDSNATIHNLYIVDNFAFTSYYTAGFRVFDISDPRNPLLLDEFDTAPDTTSEGFAGAFGAYTFAPSGNIYVSDEQNGLFIFAFKESTTDVNIETPDIPTEFALLDNYPNPFNPTTTLSYQLSKDAEVTLVIYNTLGQTIRTLVNAFQPAGFQRVVWDGRDDSGNLVPSGLYFYQIQTDGFRMTKRMLLLK